jgi:hypothetical protein
MKKHGFRYREAANGLEAVKLYQATTPPRFNIVLMGMLSILSLSDELTYHRLCSPLCSLPTQPFRAELSHTSINTTAHLTTIPRPLHAHNGRYDGVNQNPQVRTRAADSSNDDRCIDGSCFCERETRGTGERDRLLLDETCEICEIDGTLAILNRSARSAEANSAGLLLS